jgi:Trypsin-like peptidase domain
MSTISHPSVQSLLIQMRFGAQAISTGTGFVCDSAKGPVLITNWHNITGRDPETKQPVSPTGAIPDTLRIVHNRAGKLGHWLTKTEKLFTKSKARWIEHPTLGDKADIVALPMRDLADVQLYPYDPNGGPAIEVNPADSVSVVGFPFGLQAGGSLAIWATGFVASEPAIDFNALPLFLVDCRTRQGQSGSAVIAHRNSGSLVREGSQNKIFNGPVTRFLGVYSGRINKESDLGMVWKASAVSELIAAV